jgi:ElaB/YqjD/DUF883 family membrane-anchored ribosome-binding protein
MFSNNTKEIAANLKNDAKDMQRDAKDAAYSAKRDVGKSLGGEGRETITEFASEAGRTARNYFEAANDYVGHTADKVNDEIHSNPVRSSLLALGAGFIIGSLFRR